MSPAPAAQAQGPAAAMASGNGKQPPETPTELQRGAESFMDMAEILAGGEPEPEQKPAKEKPEAKPAAKEPPAKPNPKEPKAPEAKVEDEEKGDKPILGDDPADSDDDDEDGADGGKGDATTLEAKLFKQREKRRAAEKLASDAAADLAKLKKENEELKAQKAAPATTDAAPPLGGPFAEVKEEADLETLESLWQDWIDDLSEKKDGFTQDGTDYSGEQVTKRIAELKAWKRAIPQARKILTEHAKQQQATADKQKSATEKANALYPFVTNSGKKHNDVALSLAQEFPELNSSPNRALLLGMLTTARLVEQKKFTITPTLLKSKETAATPAQAEAVPARKAAPVPPPAPAPSRASVPDTSNHEHARMIAGDMEAAADWALGLVGED